MLLYGARDASANWEAEYTRTMLNGGFTRGQSSTCHFWNADWDVRVLVHGDDFVAVGPRAGLKKCRELMENTYECKVQETGTEKDQERELRFLGRMISYVSSGIRYEPDPSTWRL